MSKYTYRKPVRRSRYSELRRYVFITAGLLILIGAAGLYIYQNLHAGSNPVQPISNAQESLVSNQQQLFAAPFFQFEDTGQWVLEKSVSTDDNLVYTKYRGQIHEAQLRIYINRVPTPINLQTSRVLPVRFINNQSFQVTGVSDPCVTKYPAGQPHHVTELTVNGALMLCDPDATTYKVILSEEGGDYRLLMQRPDGEPVQFVITYEDLGLTPTADSIVNIAKSFKTR